MNQHKYIFDLLEEFQCSNYSHISSLLEASIKLAPDMGNLLSDLILHRRFVGKLNFLDHTRPDISFAVQHLS